MYMSIAIKKASRFLYDFAQTVYTHMNLCYRVVQTAVIIGGWNEYIVSSWPTSAADHWDRLMCWRVPQKEHERVSEIGVFRRRTASLKLSACRITWQRYLTCTVQETFEDTLVCVGLRRIAAVTFLRHVQSYLLSYLLTYLLTYITEDHVT